MVVPPLRGFHTLPLLTQGLRPGILSNAPWGQDRVNLLRRALSSVFCPLLPSVPMPVKKVAAVTTEYRKWSHADVILRNLLDGYPPDGMARPNLGLVSLVTDQVPG